MRKLPISISLACATLVFSTAALSQQPAPKQMVYPSKGQTPEQQKTDEAQCNTWAVQQSGYDPELRRALRSAQSAAMMSAMPPQRERLPEGSSAATRIVLQPRNKIRQHPSNNRRVRPRSGTRVRRVWKVAATASNRSHASRQLPPVAAASGNARLYACLDRHPRPMNVAYLPMQHVA